MKEKLQNGECKPRCAQPVCLAAWLPVLLWMLAIFCFSAQTGDASQAHSDGIGMYILRLLDSGFDALTPAQQAARVQSVQLVIRKGAHMMEYALLGTLFWNALRMSSERCGIRGSRASGGERHGEITRSAPAQGLTSRPALLATLCSALYAVTDELHQHFVPGRSARLTDVCIDTAGALLGVLACVAAQKALRCARRQAKKGAAVKNQQNDEKTV